MWSFIVGLFIFWRLSLFVFAYLGSKFFAFIPRFPYSDVFLIPSKLPSWLWSFANFDGVHYLTIAQKGYSAQFTQVFFPLYPLLIRLVNTIIPVNPIVVGLFISNIFFLLSLVMLKKILLMDYKKDSVKWMILFLVFFPTSFFFGSLYTESLFLFLVISSFYAARRKRWWLAGILGGLASATRFVGIFLLPALLWEWQKNKFKVRAVVKAAMARRQQSSKFKVTIQNSKLSKSYLKILHFARPPARQALCTLHSPILYLVPLGLSSYMLYLQLAFGDWLYFWHVQPVFGAGRSGGGIIFLPQVFWRYFKILFTLPWSSYNFWVAFWELGSLVVGCGLWVVGFFKKIRASYLIFSLLAILLPTFTGTFSSMPRYILVAFPMFIVLGIIKNKLTKIMLLAISYWLLAIFTLLFTRGHWVS